MFLEVTALGLSACGLLSVVALAWPSFDVKSAAGAFA